MHMHLYKCFAPSLLHAYAMYGHVPCIWSGDSLNRLWGSIPLQASSGLHLKCGPCICLVTVCTRSHSVNCACAKCITRTHCACVGLDIHPLCWYDVSLQARLALTFIHCADMMFPYKHGLPAACFVEGVLCCPVLWRAQTVLVCVRWCPCACLLCACALNCHVALLA